MAHFVKGLIAARPVLERFARRHALHEPAGLAVGLAILPLRDSDLDSFLKGPYSGDPEGDYYLSEQFSEELRAASRGAAIMYFETEYFGGCGAQAAVLFQDGELIFGPAAAKFGPINGALKLLGVRAEPPARDEFETVGLGRHRTVEDWLK